MKKKLALRLDDLAVSSFETTRIPTVRGTVLGNGQTQANTCPATCAFSCPGTCEISCVASCISTCDAAPCGPAIDSINIC
ncbi:MAG TPA: hypothetical protein VF771_00785 [Longimicrobiaceae bacterium]